MRNYFISPVRYIIIVTLLFLLFCSCGSSHTVLEKPFPLKPSDFRETIVREPIFNSDVYIYEAGIDKPVSAVLIHGIGEDLCSKAWDYITPDLSVRYHVVAFDLPGFCRSTKQNLLYSPERYADFIKWVVDNYTKNKYIIIGHSFGGAVALRYASAQPDNLQRLILVDAAGVLHRLVCTKHVINMKTKQNPSGLSGWWKNLVNAATESFMENIEKTASPEDLDKILQSPFLRKIVLGGNPTKIAGLALMQDNFSGIIEKIKAPTLIIWGDNDNIAPLRTGKILKAKISNAHFKVIENSGHMPMIDQPEKFKDILIAQKHSTSIQQHKHISQISEARCQDQEGMVFTGQHKTIEITNCKKVLIADSSAEMIFISDSDVTIENSIIKGNDFGMKVKNSEVTLTAVNIHANIGVLSIDSSIDFAGVELTGVEAAIITPNSSDVLFSVSKVQSPYTSGYMHGLYKITKDKPL